MCTCNTKTVLYRLYVLVHLQVLLFCGARELGAVIKRFMEYLIKKSNTPLLYDLFHKKNCEIVTVEHSLQSCSKRKLSLVGEICSVIIKHKINPNSKIDTDQIKAELYYLRLKTTKKYRYNTLFFKIIYSLKIYEKI